MQGPMSSSIQLASPANMISSLLCFSRRAQLCMSHNQSSAEAWHDSVCTPAASIQGSWEALHAAQGAYWIRLSSQAKLSMST